MEKQLKLEEIILDRKNPRFVTRKNKDENIANFMIRNSKLQNVIDMIEDIIENGLMPLDIIGVFKEGEKYVALDGNRRLLALKIIYENDKIKLPKEIQEILKNNLSKIGERKSSLKEIKVFEFKNREDAIKALERKHTSDFGGASHQDWPTLEKKIFQKDNLALIIANEAEAAGIEYEDFAINVKYTIWERFFASRFSREWLGVEYNNENKKFIIKNKEKLHERFIVIVKATNDKKLNFTSVNKKTDKIKSIKMMNENYLQKSTFSKTWSKKYVDKKRKRKRKINFNIESTNITNDKLSNLITQINKLTLMNYKELIACSIRPIVEISVNTYAEKIMKEPNDWFEKALSEKIYETIYHLDIRKINPKNITTIRYIRDNLSKSVLMWNGDLHDSIFSSGNYELEEEIKRISIFLEEIWTKINPPQES